MQLINLFPAIYILQSFRFIQEIVMKIGIVFEIEDIHCIYATS